MFKGTGITALYLDQDPQETLKKKMGNIYGAYIQKACARAQGKKYETETITIISRQIGRKLNACKNTAPPPVFNMAPAEDPSITSVLTQEDVED